MILDKLMVAEQVALQKIKVGNRRMKAISSIRKLMEQIDFQAEVVPVEDRDKLSVLLVSLKGGELDEREKELVEELIVENK